MWKVLMWQGNVLESGHNRNPTRNSEVPKSLKSLRKVQIAFQVPQSQKFKFQQICTFTPAKAQSGARDQL